MSLCVAREIAQYLKQRVVFVLARGQEFESKHPHGSSQPSITVVLGNPTPSLSSDLQQHLGIEVVHKHTCKQNIHTHKS